MAYDDDDLFGEDFDFVDEDEDETAAQQEPDDQEPDDQEDEAKEAAPSKPKRRSNSRGGKRAKKPLGSADAEGEEAQQSADDSEKADSEKADSEKADSEKADSEKAPEEPPGPPADHVVHVYEFGKFTRTIKREFTSEDAAAFVVEYNRTSASHSREAVAASRDEEPASAV